MEYQNLLVTSALIIAFCTVCDFVSTPDEDEENNEILEKWYNNLWNFSYPDAIKKINSQFLVFFDSIYGQKHWSLHCFKRSIITTLASMIILTVISQSGQLEYWSEYFADQKEGSIISLALFITINAVVDYFSLLETRWILGYSARSSPRYLAIFALLDLLATTLILIAVYSLVAAGTEVFIDEGNMPLYLIPMVVWSAFSNILLPLVEVTEAESFLYVVFYSTFATSVLYYLYVISNLGIKALAISKKRLMPIISKIQKSNHTYKTIGAILSAFMGLINASVSFVGEFI